METKLTDLKTGKIMSLEYTVDKFGIIEVQPLDFAISLFLETKDWESQPGFNKMFVSNGQGNANLKDLIQKFLPEVHN